MVLRYFSIPTIQHFCRPLKFMGFANYIIKIYSQVKNITFSLRSLNYCRLTSHSQFHTETPTKIYRTWRRFQV